MITVGLFDDHPVILAGLEAYLAQIPGIKVLWTAHTLENLNKVYESDPPDVIVVDFRITASEAESTTLSWLKDHPRAQVVVYSGFYLERNVRDAFQYGARAWIRKSDPLEDLVEAIRNAGIGKKTIRSTDEVFFEQDILMDLSARETEVLKGLFSGKSNKEISIALDVSETTVKTHLAHLFAKLSVSSRLEAVRIGIERGLLTVPVEAAEPSKTVPVP